MLENRRTDGLGFRITEDLESKRIKELEVSRKTKELGFRRTEGSGNRVWHKS